MNRSISLVLASLFFAAFLGGCAEPPVKPVDNGNSADEQRARAARAQGELSSETRK